MQRDTPQRRAIRRALAAADRPLSPEEIHRAARRRRPGLGIATVYRAIAALLNEGRLAAVEMPGEPPRYETAGKPHHHHFQCRRCGRVFEIDGCPKNLKALTPPGFRLESHEVVLYGRCAACA